MVKCITSEALTYNSLTLIYYLDFTMKMSSRVLIIFGLFLLINYLGCKGEEEVKSEEKSDPATVAPVIERSSHHHHHHEDPTYQGFWKKKFVWRPRWVKTWQEKKIYVAVWKRMWGPAVINEWVPVPKPPPGWVKEHSGNYFIKGHH